MFIIIDDLLSVVYNRHRLGVRIKTPNLDRLAAEGISFVNAFCSTALCCPSRMAILTGRNPFATGIHTNSAYWVRTIDLAETFPGMMAHAGWECFAYGKIVHSKSEVLQSICVEVIGSTRVPENDAEIVDFAIARLAVARNPSLVMVGLRGPHRPHGQHPEFNVEYPIKEIVPIDWKGEAAQSTEAELQKRITYFISWATKREVVRKAIREYLSDVTAMDEQLGRLLDAIPGGWTVVLTSDHGYSLGDHDISGKFTLWDEAGRAPLMIRRNGASPGQINKTVSLLDIAPTMLWMAGLPQPEWLDGASLAPFFTDRHVGWNNGAVTSMGDSLSFRGNQFRIIEYADGVIELYDQTTDPRALDNLADHPGYAIKLNEMRAKLRNRRQAWGAPPGPIVR